MLILSPGRFLDWSTGTLSTKFCEVHFVVLWESYCSSFWDSVIRFTAVKDYRVAFLLSYPFPPAVNPDWTTERRSREESTWQIDLVQLYRTFTLSSSERSALFSSSSPGFPSWIDMVWGVVNWAQMATRKHWDVHYVEQNGEDDPIHHEWTAFPSKMSASWFVGIDVLDLDFGVQVDSVK